MYILHSKFVDTNFTALREMLEQQLVGKREVFLEWIGWRSDVYGK
jgi:hypothetical protein